MDLIEATPDSQLTFGPSQTYAASDALDPQTLTLKADHPRAAALPSAASVFGDDLNWSWRLYDFARPASLGQAVPAPLPGSAAPQPSITTSTVCLFNLLVACEWAPDAAYLETLQWAFRHASNFLYDVSNGVAAFGQVIIGGPDLLPHADVQILASNRWHPRSWVSGLYQEAKQRPIRIGRTLWIKSLSLDVAWNEPEGYRVLVHEWLHYALGLKDSYLQPETAGYNTFYIPNRHVPSVMSNPSGNSELEFVVQDGTSTAVGWAALVQAAQDARHPLHEIDLGQIERNPGPYYLPLPLPQYVTLEAPAPPMMTQPTIPLPASVSHGWAFRLKSGMQPELTALGRFDGIQTIPLESAASELLLIGQSAAQSTISCYNAGAWQDATPTVYPLISVVPGSATSGAVALSVAAHFPAGYTVDSLDTWVFPTGDTPQNASAGPISTSALDGNVLVTWTSGGSQYRLIAPFSRGGGPASHNPAGANPLSAGSGEGNLLLFSNPDLDDPALEQLYVVTTTQLADAYALPASTDGTNHACSYGFCMAANGSLNVANLYPTAVFFFDNESIHEGTRFRVQRGSLTGSPQLLTNTDHLVSIAHSFAALSLNATTAAELLLPAPTPVFYRLYALEG